MVLVIPSRAALPPKKLIILPSAPPNWMRVFSWVLTSARSATGPAIAAARMISAIRPTRGVRAFMVMGSEGKAGRGEGAGRRSRVAETAIMLVEGIGPSGQFP